MVRLADAPYVLAPLAGTVDNGKGYKKTHTKLKKTVRDESGLSAPPTEGSLGGRRGRSAAYKLSLKLGCSRRATR